jgi:hypothetical protein
MNERIKELYLKAHSTRYYDGDPALDGNPPTVYWQGEASAQRFAELIVRECYETIKKDMELAHIQLIPIDFGIYANGRLRRIIREKFGVEE